MTLAFSLENKDIFEALMSGKKTIETRAMDSKYENIAQCRHLTFSCGERSFDRKLKGVTFFKTVEDLLAVYKPEDINPKLHTAGEILEMYGSFPGYKERIAERGLFAIELENI